MKLEEYIEKIYGQKSKFNCPFTEAEIAELERTNELLVYLPANTSQKELCDKFGIKTNIDFENEKMIRNIMVSEPQWFITSANKTPELIYKSAKFSQRVYEDEGLHGMDLRRYLAFVATYKHKFGEVPDNTYWTFLLAGNYDRSGVSVVGFDIFGVLSHHGWMKDFKTKFCGSRYIVLPPRIEINPQTENLIRAYRGKITEDSKEASMG